MCSIGVALLELCSLVSCVRSEVRKYSRLHGEHSCEIRFERVMLLEETLRNIYLFDAEGSRLDKNSSAKENQLDAPCYGHSLLEISWEKGTTLALRNA